MPKILIINDTVLTAGGGTVNLVSTDYVDLYRLSTSGAVTLTSNYTIQASGTLSEGMEYIFHYTANLDFDGNSLTIMGVAVPAALQAVSLQIRAYYNGSAWEVTMATDFGVEPLIATSMYIGDSVNQAAIGASAVGRTELIDGEIIAVKLATDSVIEAKILNGAVTVGKLGGTLKQEVIVVPVSFETGSLANNSIIIPFNCTLITIRTDVVTLIEATDNATISPQINTVSTSPSAITLAGGSAVNTTATNAMVTAAITAGDELRLITTKTTPGGRALVTLTLLRT